MVGCLALRLSQLAACDKRSEKTKSHKRHTQLLCNYYVIILIISK